jgi:hypothetical protein
LVYLHHLKNTNASICVGNFYAIDCGVVHVTVYEKLAKYGRNGFVTRFIRDDDNEVRIIGASANSQIASISTVWNVHKDHTVDELAAIIMCEHGAWRRARLRRDRDMQLVTPRITECDMRAELDAGG